MLIVSKSLADDSAGAIVMIPFYTDPAYIDYDPDPFVGPVIPSDPVYLIPNTGINLGN